MTAPTRSPEGSAEWHYEKAMDLLRWQNQVPPDEWRADEAAVIVAEAQVHATLALYRIQATEALR